MSFYRVGIYKWHFSGTLVMLTLLVGMGGQADAQSPQRNYDAGFWRLQGPETAAQFEKTAWDEKGARLGHVEVDFSCPNYANEPTFINVSVELVPSSPSTVHYLWQPIQQGFAMDYITMTLVRIDTGLPIPVTSYRKPQSALNTSHLSFTDGPRANTTADTLTSLRDARSVTLITSLDDGRHTSTVIHPQESDFQEFLQLCAERAKPSSISEVHKYMSIKADIAKATLSNPDYVQLTSAIQQFLDALQTHNQAAAIDTYTAITSVRSKYENGCSSDETLPACASLDALTAIMHEQMLQRSLALKK